MFDEVYKVIKQIPKGRVATYGQIARLIQNSNVKAQNYNSITKITPRVVGFALHANKDLKTPCHRVVDRNGRLAPNFAFNGAEEQRKRLKIEGISFIDKMHVDLKKHLWQPK